MVMAALLILLLLASNAQATNYNFWKADSATTKFGACAQMRDTTFDTSDKHEGTGSAKWTSNNTQQDSVCYDIPSPATYNGADGGFIYYRWWMKMDSSFNWGSVTQKMKTGRVAPSGGVPSQVWTMYLDNGRIYVGECPMCEKQGNAPKDDPSDAVLSYDFSPSNAVLLSWGEYIIGIKKQTCVACFDGEFHVWVNGTQIGSVTTMRWCNTTAACSSWDEQWGGVMYKTFPQYNDASAGGIIWLDDLSTDDTFNSNFSSPSTVMMKRRVQ